MLNSPAKCLLALTSLAPVLGALFVSNLDQGEPWKNGIYYLMVAFVREPWKNGLHYLIIAFLLFILCWLLLSKYASKELEIEPLEIKEFDRRDMEMLTFLLIYLLPFIQSADPLFARGWLTNIYVISIITLVFVDVGAFQFNPMMRLIGYRFYIVKNQDGISYLLISKRVLKETGIEVPVVPISHDIYLYTEDKNAQVLQDGSNCCSTGRNKCSTGSTKFISHTSSSRTAAESSE